MKFVMHVPVIYTVELKRGGGISSVHICAFMFLYYCVWLDSLITQL